MTKKTNNPRTYTIALGGDGLDVTMLELSPHQASRWKGTDPKEMYAHLFLFGPEDGEEERELSDTVLPMWEALPRERHLLGVERHNGWLEVTDDSGKCVYSKSLEEDDFWDDHVDDSAEYDDLTMELPTGATLVATVSSRADIQYTVVTQKRFDPKRLYVAVSSINGIEIVSSVFYADELLEPEFSGGYYWFEAKLLTRSAESEENSEVSYRGSPNDDENSDIAKQYLASLNPR